MIGGTTNFTAKHLLSLFTRHLQQYKQHHNTHNNTENSQQERHWQTLNKMKRLRRESSSNPDCKNSSPRALRGQRLRFCTLLGLLIVMAAAYLSTYGDLLRMQALEVPEMEEIADGSVLVGVDQEFDHHDEIKDGSTSWLWSLSSNSALSSQGTLEGKKKKRDAVMDDLTKSLLDDDEEMVPIPVDVTDLRMKKLGSTLYSFVILSDETPVRVGPSTTDAPADRVLQEGEVVVGIRLIKKIVTWVQLDKGMYFPLAINANSPSFRRLAKPYLKLIATKAFNVRLREEMSDCTKLDKDKERSACEQRNQLRREIKRIADSYDVIDYTPKVLGGSRSGPEQAKVVELLEMVFAMNAPFETVETL